MAILSPAMRLAIEVNAERDHFREKYEGFYDCSYINGGVCDCGKAEAEAALAEVRSMQEVI